MSDEMHAAAASSANLAAILFKQFVDSVKLDAGVLRMMTQFKGVFWHHHATNVGSYSWLKTYLALHANCQHLVTSLNLQS
jgi:hypothetical protein